MKNAFHGFTGPLDTVKERISALEDMTIETSKTEKKKDSSRQNKIPKNWGTVTKGIMYV